MDIPVTTNNSIVVRSSEADSTDQISFLAARFRGQVLSKLKDKDRSVAEFFLKLLEPAPKERRDSSNLFSNIHEVQATIHMAVQADVLDDEVNPPPSFNDSLFGIVTSTTQTGENDLRLPRFISVEDEAGKSEQERDFIGGELEFPDNRDEVLSSITLVGEVGVPLTWDEYSLEVKNSTTSKLEDCVNKMYLPKKSE